MRIQSEMLSINVLYSNISSLITNTIEMVFAVHFASQRETDY
jgi:hypothetical protein